MATKERPEWVKKEINNPTPTRDEPVSKALLSRMSYPLGKSKQ